MALQRGETHLLLFSFLLLAPTSSSSEVAAELISLRSNFTDGVIRLSSDLLRRIMSIPSRSFSFVVFFDAPPSRLDDLRSEFDSVSYSFLVNHPDSNNHLFFFATDLLLESIESFSLFGVTTLPQIRIVSPNIDDLRISKNWDQERFNSLSTFIEFESKVHIGPIDRRAIVSGTEKALAGATVLCLSLGLLKKGLFGEPTGRDLSTRICSVLLIYFFSVAGSVRRFVHCEPPLIFDSESTYLYKGSEIQHVVEANAAGLLYTIVGLMLAVITHVAVGLRSVKEQRIVMYVALTVCMWGVIQLIYLHNRSTGHSLRSYWPSTWHSHRFTNTTLPTASHYDALF